MKSFQSNRLSEEQLAAAGRDDNHTNRHFVTVDDAINWLCDAYSLGWEQAEWLYGNSKCPHWDEPEFKLYDFLNDPAMAKMPEESELIRETGS